MTNESQGFPRAAKKSKTSDSSDKITDALVSPSGTTEVSRNNRDRFSSPSDKVTDKGSDSKKLFVQVTEEASTKIDINLFSPHKGLKSCIDPEKVVEMVASTLKSDTKLTRSKAKHINDPFVSGTSSTDPISECAVLLHHDLPEDSTDDEYDPVHEDSSDNESKVSESPFSPYPPTPSTVVDVSQSSLGTEENIGQRTRSKLSLSTTAIETIEQQFIPPDITTDMYDTDCDNKEWLQFLKEFQNPILEKTVEHTEDDNDPEYCLKNDNIENIDFEELRHDRGVQVTKRELHDLMIEWFGCSSPFSSEEESLSLPSGNLKNSSKENVSLDTPKDAPMSFSKLNFEARDKLKIQDTNCSLPNTLKNDKSLNKSKEEKSRKCIKGLEKGGLLLSPSPNHEPMINNEVNGHEPGLNKINKNMQGNRNVEFGSQLTPSKNEKNCLRNREQSFSDEAIQELDEEIERQLEAKAHKNKLSVRTVKNIIKAVVTNEDVVEMVSSTMKGSSLEPVMPRLTRAWAKELRNQANCEHLVSEVKKKRAIILDEDLDDEEGSDDEYNPQVISAEENSNDEDNSKTNLSILSSHPASPRNYSEICGEMIGQRTRSKLDLQSTSLEKIERSFIPPDVTDDMYDTACDNTEWIEFLKGIHHIESNELVTEETDTEFNIMEESMDELDEEELRYDKGVKISKKELRTLRNDSFLPFSESDNEETVNKGLQPIQEPQPTVECHSDKPKEVEVPVQLSIPAPTEIAVDQVLLLQQQIQQHVQLLLQSFVLAYKHPLIEESLAINCKEMLLQLHYLGFSSRINGIHNLQPSLELIKEWETYLSNRLNYLKMLHFYQKEEIESVQMANQKRMYFPKLPPMLMNACESSTAFFYPLLLPDHGFRHKPPERNPYSPSESCLIAIALSNYFEHMEENGENGNLRQACSYICSILMPSHTLKSVMCHVESMNRKVTVFNNPIKTYIETGKAPVIKHYVIQLNLPYKKLCDQPRVLLPPSWQGHFKRKETNQVLTH